MCCTPPPLTPGVLPTHLRTLSVLTHPADATCPHPAAVTRCHQAGEKEELADRAKGDLVTALLPVLDNFELARTQVKGETEGEQKIINSYQVTVGGGGVAEGICEVGRGATPRSHAPVFQ
jgi:hypothetical protein